VGKNLPALQCLHGLRNPIFPKKSNFLGIRFFGHLGHGLRNPIFPKNRIYWASDLLGTGFLFHFLARLGTRFEKSDFSKKSDLLGTGFLFHFLAGLGTRFEKSDFSKKIEFLGHQIFWAPWARFEKSDFSKRVPEKHS
jgi:hypothetical protein